MPNPTPELPEWLKDRIEIEAFEYNKMPKKFIGGQQGYITGATEYAAIAIQLRDALDIMKSEMQKKNKAYERMLSGMPERQQQAHEQGNYFEEQELKILYTTWGTSCKERQACIDTITEALALFPVDDKNSKTT